MHVITSENKVWISMLMPSDVNFGAKKLQGEKGSFKMIKRWIHQEGLWF